MATKKSQSSVSFQDTRVLINGNPTYEGRQKCEGLLFNLRTVNATFDDTLGVVSYWNDDGSRPENGYACYGPWRSPESAFANTQRFVMALPEYRAWGVLAVNLNFQGGHPLVSKKWIRAGWGSATIGPYGQRDFLHNSGFQPHGSIDENYAKRISSVIEACDRLGMVVILQLFYFGQDTVFPNENAIRSAVDHAVDFVCSRGYRNVVIEIANEVMQGHYHHEILKPGRLGELIDHAHRRAEDKHKQKLLVSTSEAGLLNPKQWTHEQIDTVYGRSDLVLLHGGDAEQVARKIDFIRSRFWFGQRPRPIVFNESSGEPAFESALDRGVSFGLHSGRYLQTMWPPRWGVWENEIIWFFRKVKELTGSLGTEF